MSPDGWFSRVGRGRSGMIPCRNHEPRQGVAVSHGRLDRLRSIAREGHQVSAVRRAIFYLFYDSQGIVDDYVPHMLGSLRPHAEHIFVVSNSRLTPASRTKLESVADTVFVRENVGFDVWGYKQALEAFGREKLAEYDEIILMNYTVFGPVYPFSEMFDRVEALDVDFWGVTSHAKVDPNPYGTPGFPFLPEHIQSHWIAVRNRLFTSLEFEEYWDTMPMITSYAESIVNHESRFTQYFADKGFRFEVLYPVSDFPDDHPIFENFGLMLDARCPIVKRRIFFHEPTYLDRRAVIARRLIDRVEQETDYPAELIWQNVVRTVEPRTLHTNLSLLEILPDVEDGSSTPGPVRLAVLAHLFYEDMVDEVMGFLSRIPVPYHLYVTTSTATRQAVIEESLAAYDIERVEVRVTEQNRGRDMSSLFISFRDVLTSGEYDLMLRLHSKRSPQNDYNQGQLFKSHMFDNLLSSTAYVNGVLRLFQENPTLGMAFPPVVNIGFPTLGHSWFTNKPMAEVWAKKLGITTEFDRSTPIAPYGTMFWFRPEALRDFTDYPFKWADYPAEPGHNDGGLAHVQERLLAYAAMNAGFHVRSIMNASWAAINYTFLEYRMQRLSALLPEAYPQEQVDFITRMSDPNPFSRVKFALMRRSPRLANALKLPYRTLRATYRGSRSVSSRLRRS